MQHLNSQLLGTNTLGSDQGAAYGAQGPQDYDTVAASQTDSELNGPATRTAGKGDILSHLVCVVTDEANAAVSIKDGGAGGAISVLPAAVSSKGTYVIPLGMVAATGSWTVTTGSGVTVIAFGSFSA